MPRFKLARPRWRLGQVLMPAQLAAQEEALSAEAALRNGLLGLPRHGLARLSWDEAALAGGVVSIAALTVVLPSGAILDVPGNAAASTLRLDEAGERAVEVYLHALRETGGAEGLDGYQDDPREVERVIHRIELSTRPHHDEGIASLKLAELERAPDGRWSLQGRHAPPLVQVGASPFLRGALDALRQDLLRLDGELGERLRDTLLGGERRAAMRRAATEVARLRAALLDIDHGIERHPYFTFNALRSFYLELCALHDAAPPPEPVPYTHDAPAACFGRVLRLISDLVATRRAAAPYRMFERRDGRLVAADLPDEALSAAEVYLLIQRPRVAEEVAIDGLKLASPSRLETVYRLSLSGVPHRPAPAPPVACAFGPEVDFYLLSRGREWEQVARERALCFYELPSLGDAAAALAWSAG